jgi:hypothetical protein
VIDDFNDDVDGSIVAGYLTPFTQLRDDAAPDWFTTRGLSIASHPWGETSAA